MREIRVEKIVINIGCGEGGEKLEKAKKILVLLTKNIVVATQTSKRTTFGTPKGRPIGCMTTLRGKEAVEFLKKAFEAVDNKLPLRVFDRQGSFSFGIREYIDIPGARYDPEIGLYGMDVCVSLGRKGFRVLRKRISTHLGKGHRIAPQEAAQFISQKFGIKVE